MRDVLRVIEEFNNKHNIKDVIESITGVQIKRKSLCCPLHGGDNNHGASINPAKNIFTCWTSDCGRGLTPWKFISKYYNLNGFKEVAEKANFLFNANIPIYEKNSVQAPEKHLEGDKILKVEKYLSECKSSLGAEIEEYNHILLNANTGLGKTYGLIDLLKDNKSMDYIFLLVPTRSIAEQVTKDYPIFNIFYGNDIILPKSRYIVSTYHKIHMLEKAIDSEIEARAILGEFPPMYTVIVDEVHELQSKRKLLGNKARIIEDFVKNSDNSILMSANTSYINKTYKDKGLFNRYITVYTENIKYNADNFNILRLPKGNDQKRVLTINLIKDKLQAYNNVIFYEDSIEQLKAYEGELKALGLECIVINSQNKSEEDEVAEEYKNIIENSKLNKTIILTTSLINAGVNIKSNKVALIVKQDINKFDIQKVEQFLARVRTNDNDLTLILGSTDKEKPKNILNYDLFVNELKEIAEIKAKALNNGFLNQYGLDITHEFLLDEWKECRNNIKYREVADIIYIENGIFKVDEPMIYEQARLEFEKANYYNDKFILDQLANVKAKNKKIIYLAPVTVEKKEVLKEENTLKDNAEILLGDSGALAETLEVAEKKKKINDLENEIAKEFHKKYSQNKIYKEMMSNLRNAINTNKRKDISKVNLLMQIIKVYTKDIGKKQRDIEVQNIKRREKYNKLFPLGTDLERIDLKGDDIYYIVRKNFDCYCKNKKHPISKSAYSWAFEDIYKLREYRDSVDKKNRPIITDKKGKKINIEDINQELEKCVYSIYDVSSKGYISRLL